MPANLKGIVCVLGLMGCGSAKDDLGVVNLSSEGLREIVTFSDLVLDGTAARTRSDWGRNRWGDELIYTTVSFDVQEAVRGTVEGAEASFRFEGGRVGEVELTVADAARIDEGQRALVFLRRGDSGPVLLSHPHASLPRSADVLLDEVAVTQDELRERLRSIVSDAEHAR